MLPILELLRADGSIVINKKLMQTLGINETIIYSELISRYAYFEGKNQLTDDLFFFNTAEDLEKGTTLTDFQQRKPIQKLIKLGLIEMDKRGLPCKRYFKIIQDIDVLNKLLKNDTENNSEQVLKKPQTSIKETKELVSNKLELNNNQLIIQKDNKEITINSNLKNTKDNNVIVNTKDTNLLETPKEEIKKEKKKKHFDVLADMVDEFTTNQKLREKLKEYLLFRIQRGLKVNQWQIILDDLKKACKDDNERLIDVNGAIAGGYHVIIPSWKLNNNKNNKQAPGGTQRLGLPSVKRMTEEEKRKWREENLIRDKNGDIITF
jgi:hypothetical protein